MERDIKTQEQINLMTVRELIKRLVRNGYECERAMQRGGESSLIRKYVAEEKLLWARIEQKLGPAFKQ